MGELGEEVVVKENYGGSQCIRSQIKLANEQRQLVWGVASYSAYQLSVSCRGH